MGQTAGLAHTDIDFVDLSVIIGTGIKGIAGILTTADMGIHNKRYPVRTWEEYTRYLGGLRADTLGPLYCRRALEAGCQLEVSRQGHYSTITNPATLVGTKAAVTAGQTTTGSIVSVVVGASGKFRIATDLTQYFTAGASFTVTGSTGNNGTYTVVSSAFVSGNTEITVATVPSATGDGSITYTSKKVVLTAEAVGTGYNDVSVTIAAAASGIAGKVDITISKLNYPNLDQTIPDFNQTPSVGDVTNFNTNYIWVDMGTPSFTGILPIGTFTLTGGVEDVSLVVAADFIGDQSASLGIYSFDDSDEIVRIACPEKAINAIDVALANYAKARKDIRSVSRTPIGISGNSGIDYREATGVYTGGVAVDTMFASMEFGSLLVVDPLSGAKIEISAIADSLGAMARKDSNQYEWFAAAGSRRGRVSNALGVVYDLGTPGRKLEGGAVDAHGLNPTIKHKSFGFVRWGNGSLAKVAGLTKYENVAELLVFLYRAISPLTDVELFEPNDPITWNLVYRHVKKVMDIVANKRGVQGIEGIGWKYDGDQFVDNVADAVINQPNDIALGKYVFYLYLKPTNALKYIKATVVVTTTDVDFTNFEVVDTI